VSKNRQAILLHEFPLDVGAGFDEHEHDDHQLAWVREGVLMVTIGARHWMLPPTLALWIPAGVPHSSFAARGAATMQGIYLPSEAMTRWHEPVVVGVTSLVRDLIGFLRRDDIADTARSKAEALLVELLEPVDSLAIDVPMPRDERAVKIAQGLLDDPADERDLVSWGRHVGASARTLSRIFAAETGMGFAQWRTRLRIRSSLPLLAAGEPVGATAGRVGFSTASAFIAAFGHLTGMTPGSYFARLDELARSRHDLAD